MRMEYEPGARVARGASQPACWPVFDDPAADDVTDAIVALDARSRVISWNKAAEQLYGIARNDALGCPFADLISWHSDANETSPKPARLTGAVNLLSGAAIHVVRPGRWIPVWVSVASLRQRDGAKYYVLVIRDDTKHALSTASLHDGAEFEILLSEMSARFAGLSEDEIDGEINRWLTRLVQMLRVDRSSFAELCPDGLAVTHSYAVRGVEPYPKGFVGDALPWLTREFSAGRTVVLSRIPDDLPEEALEERRAMSQSGIKAGIGVPVFIAGSLICVLTFGAFREPRVWSKEVVSRLKLIGEVFANAIARRKAKQQLEQKQLELAHVARVAAMGELASVIAHELDQPLTAVVTNAQAVRTMLKAESTELAEVDEALVDVINAAMRVSDIAQRERRLLRKSGGVLEQVDLNEAIREVELFIRAEARQCCARVTTELLPGLPSVQGDRVQLQQAALNLARNGLQAMKDQPRALRQLMIRTSESDDEVVLSVTDAGPPVDERLLGRMFEPFYTTKPNGLGMGLSISKSIVDSHRGRIWCTCNARGGLTMSVSIPRK